MRAFVYCRVSTKEQGTEDHYSLENQEQRCRDYIKMKHWRLIKVRKDIASGKDSQRDGYQELLSDIREHHVDVVLVYRLDRLSRNVRDIYDFLDDIEGPQVAFVSVNEGFDTTTPMGRAMLGVAAVFAQLTREMIAENTKEGLLRRAEAGLYTGNPTVLYGYDHIPNQGLKINEEEAKVVQQIFDWYTQQKWGTTKIARVLNVKGLLTRAGNEWTDTTIAKMLRNPVFCGEIRVHDGVVTGKHEGILSKEQFDEAQELIQSRAVLAPRAQDTRHLLSGLARCGICNTTLRVHHVRGSKEQQKNHIPVIIYKHKSSARTGDQNCVSLAKSGLKLEEAVVKEIKEVALSKTLEKMAVEEIKRKKRQSPSRREYEKILLELATLNNRFTQWAERLDAGNMDEDQFNLQNKKLLAQKAKLQQRMTELSRELKADDNIEVTLKEVREVLKDFPKVWENLSIEERRETLRLLIEHLKVYKTHAELKLIFFDEITLPLVFKCGRPSKKQSK